jgi:YggT family protein
MQVLCALVDLYALVVLVRVIFSFFPVAPGSGGARVVEALDLVTRPLLDPIRQVLPPLRLGATGLDLSPLVLILGLRLVSSLLGC